VKDLQKEKKDTKTKVSTAKKEVELKSSNGEQKKPKRGRPAKKDKIEQKEVKITKKENKEFVSSLEKEKKVVVDNKATVNVSSKEIKAVAKPERVERRGAAASEGRHVNSVQEKQRAYDRKQQDNRSGSRNGGFKDSSRGGGKHYNKMQDKQQQEARFLQFVKSIQEIPVEELEKMQLSELNQIARRLGIVGSSLMNKDRIVKKIVYVRAHPEIEEEVTGVLEKLPDGFGFLRSARFDYISGPDDIYVSPSQIRRFGLKTGDTVTGTIRKPKDGEKYFALLKINKVNFKAPVPSGDKLSFERLVPYHPEIKLKLENNPSVLSTRLIDLFSPIGKGQRGLLVAPPKVGKTVLLKEIAKGVLSNYPDVYLIVLLIDERPEEVTDMRLTVQGSNAEVISSTFDESASRHVQVAEIVLEKAKRMVESGNDVVVLLDSITRLARAYNTVSPASGKVLTGGIDANALQRPKKFFGAARYTKDAGSLTMIATALVDTGSRMDEVIYEEFKGTGNMEMHMTRKLANRRIYPALDLLSSGTRREDLLQPAEVLKKVWVLQKFLGTLNQIESMEFIIDKMRKHKTNEEFMDSINK